MYLLCWEEQKVGDGRKRANSGTSCMDKRLAQELLKGMFIKPKEDCEECAVV